MTDESEPVSAAIDLLKTAMTNGLAALTAGDRATGVRWLSRALRLAPRDRSVMLTMASALIGTDAGKAAELFERVLAEGDLRLAWQGLVAARSANGDSVGAANALGQLLSRHAYADDIGALARRIGITGWCGLRSDGNLQIELAGSIAPVVWLDGKKLSNTTLPDGWQGSRGIQVAAGSEPLIGSPINIASIRRLSGFVDIVDGCLAGWAWYPNDPEAEPVLTISCPTENWRRTVVASDDTQPASGLGPLARPRRFYLGLADLPGRGPIHVCGPNGVDLPGSPVDPCRDRLVNAAGASLIAQEYGGMPADPQVVVPVPALLVDVAVPPVPIGADMRRRQMTIVIPVHNGGSVVPECLDSVLASVTEQIKILVVDDGSTDPAIVGLLNNLARQRRIALIRHNKALGFPSAANAGIQAARGRDVVLLNSDTLVPPGWLERLRQAAYSSRDVGAACPLSNDASILSYPGPAGSNPRPDLAATRRLDALARRVNDDTVIDIPMGVGFCLYLRRDCLSVTGAFRADLFAQGYGEENDWCLRARRLGWRSVAVPGVFVAHTGGASFGGAAAHLRERNGRLIEQLHPGHNALIARYLERDPLFPARRRIDLAVWRERARGWRQSTVLFTHDHGGGVERRLAYAIQMHRDLGRWPVVLRHTETSAKEPAIAVCDGQVGDLPNLIYKMPEELPSLLRLLRSTKPVSVEVHHLANYHPSVYDLLSKLCVPYDVHVHDYAWLCPRVSLVAAEHRYCGEPELHECEACVVDNGHFLHETISVEELRARSGLLLAHARRVIAPSADAAGRMRRYFPDIRPEIVPHQDDVFRKSRPVHRSGRPRVCVVGAIGVHKGYHVLLACARDAAHRDLALEFVVVGHTIDDARLMDTGRVFITGEFQAGEASELIAEQQAQLGFLPSIWPETWCLALNDLWQAGLRAVAFDLGAPAERIRRSRHGIILPLGLPTAAINNSLVAAIRTARH